MNVDITMLNGPQEDALLKTILLQQKMIEDVRILHNYFRVALETLCGLDPEFERIYFAKVLAADPCELPGDIPERETLREALKAIGWTPRTTGQDSFWSPFHCHASSPWKQADCSSVSAYEANCVRTDE